MIILNLKTYPESTGENMSRLLGLISELIEEYPELNDYVMVAPFVAQLALAKKLFPKLNIISQNVDLKSPGSTTGYVPPASLLELGVEYSIFNHTEHRMWNETIVEEIKFIQSKGLKLIVCCENISEAKKIAEASPFAIVFESADLIGSGTSVTTRPEIVKQFVSLLKGKTKILIGAGVSNREDVKATINLGADGALLASAFVKSIDPKSKALELIVPFLNRPV